MDTIYKVFITILSILLLLSTGLSLSLSIADEIETNHYFSSISETLVNSHYNENVSNLLMEEAKEKGYELSIQLYGSSTIGSQKYAQLTLSYDYHLDMFGIVFNRTKQKIV